MARANRRILACAVVLTFLLPRATAAEENACEGFDRFCAEHFGAEKEEEVYLAFGKELKLVEDSLWHHTSKTSACFGWQTNLPAKTFVEYGATAAYDQRTPEPERRFSLHLHHLKGLKPATTYHYRLVAIDERGNRLAGPDATFTTRRLAGVVRVPDDVAGPPYVLDKPNTAYLVTKDLATPGTAIFIAASYITLDLGGHTITYDEKRDEAGEGACGVRGHKQRGIGLANVAVVNGFIRRGGGGSTTQRVWDTLYSPIFFSKPDRLTVAGLSVDYDGCQVVGMMLLIRGQASLVHHNVFLDRGTTLFNRHVGMDAVTFGTLGSKFHHNLIRRTRHRGITPQSYNEVYSNEIYLDSFATNSYGIMYYNNRGGGEQLDIHHNRIFGTGYHPVGIGSGQGYRLVKIHHNYIQMQGSKAEARWTGGQGGGDDPSQLHPVNGIRLQKPRDNVEHRENVIVVKGSGEGCLMRGLWLVPGESVEHLGFYSNRIKVISEDGVAEGSAISAGGAPDPLGSAAVTLSGNTVITNLCHVQFGDNYSHGGRYWFSGEKFIKVGDDPRYKTIRLGWKGWKYETFGHTFVDTAFEGGAGFDSVSFDGAQRGRYDFTVEWTLEVKGPPGAKVAVCDKAGEQVFAGSIYDTGRLIVAIAQFVQARDGRTLRTPHTVAVEREGKRATKTVTMDGPRSLEFERD